LKPETNSFVVAIAGIVLLWAIAGLAVYMAFAGGFVASKLWLWHAVPYGLPVIGWKTFGALTVFLRLFRGYDLTPKDQESDKAKWLSGFVGMLLVPWMVLLVGWWLT